MSKYHAIRTQIDDYWFDSKYEAQKYQELCLLKRGGIVKDFIMQPKFELIPAVPGVQRAIYYVADFDIYYTDGAREILDRKGFETAVFKLKKKLFRWRYPDLKLIIE